MRLLFFINCTGLNKLRLFKLLTSGSFTNITIIMSFIIISSFLNNPCEAYHILLKRGLKSHFQKLSSDVTTLFNLNLICIVNYLCNLFLFPDLRNFGVSELIIK